MHRSRKVASSKAAPVPVFGSSRSTDSICEALTKDPSLNVHAARVGELQLSGDLISLLTAGDMQELFPEVTAIQRLRLLHFLQQHQHSASQL